MPFPVIAVSNGKWSGTPGVFGYKWERCNASGGECVAILGATGQNYTPTSEDVRHTLRAVVTAINGGGGVNAVSADSELVTTTAATEYSLETGSVPSGIALGSEGDLWFTNMVDSEGKIGTITTTGSVTEHALPSSTGTFGLVRNRSLPSGGIAAGAEGDLWFTGRVDSCFINVDLNDESCSVNDAVIDKMTTAGALTEYALPHGSEPDGIVLGGEGDLWFTMGGTSKVGKITPSGTITEYALPENSGPEGITLGSDGEVWFTDRQTSKIGRITPAGAIAEYTLPSESKPTAIARGSEGDLWFAEEGSSKIAKITSAGTITEYALPAGSEPDAITIGQEGNLWFADAGTDKIAKITSAGTITEYALPSGSDPFGIVAGPEGNLWFTEHRDGKIGKLIVEPAQGAQQAPQAGDTVEYEVPVSGEGAPANLSKEEVEKWGEKEPPAEATAIFPADEPQGWPASGYKKATVDYMDQEGRTVNTRAPGGGIGTTEYNEASEVTRTLSPGNRASALGEGCVSVAAKECKSAEVAAKLDAQTEYNEEGSEIVRTLGPEHEIKLADGKEALARAVTHDYYDEGAQEAEEKNKEKEDYNLLTKSVSGALLTGGEEAEKRTTLTSYSGQNDLGWKLRKPTSTTVDPQGLDEVSSTKYEEGTGEVLETRSPAGNAESVVPLVPASTFGSAGSGSGELDEPEAVAFAPGGDVWVLDNDNNRVEKFTAAGVFVAAYGSEGTGHVQFDNPIGLAVNQATGDVYVADTGNNRIEELNITGNGKWCGYCA